VFILAAKLTNVDVITRMYRSHRKEVVSLWSQLITFLLILLHHLSGEGAIVFIPVSPTWIHSAWPSSPISAPNRFHWQKQVRQNNRPSLLYTRRAQKSNI